MCTMRQPVGGAERTVMSAATTASLSAERVVT
jgi:hypothetical protein